MRFEKVWDKVVATGVWFYDGSVPQLVEIKASNYDHGYEAELDDYEYEESIGNPDGLKRPEPHPLGPGGWLYRVDGWFGGYFESLGAAKAWVDIQPWGPVTWTAADDENGKAAHP